MYDVVEVYGDRVEDAGAEVSGCVVRGSVVRVTDAGTQVADETTYLFLVVIAHVDVNTLVPGPRTALPRASAETISHSGGSVNRQGARAPRRTATDPNRAACAVDRSKPRRQAENSDAARLPKDPHARSRLVGSI